MSPGEVTLSDSRSLAWPGLRYSAYSDLSLATYPFFYLSKVSPISFPFSAAAPRERWALGNSNGRYMQQRQYIVWPARGGRSCEHLGRYNVMNRIPLSLMGYGRFHRVDLLLLSRPMISSGLNPR